jgi:hypothetical protein
MSSTSSGIIIWDAPASEVYRDRDDKVEEEKEYFSQLQIATFLFSET